MKGGQWPFLGLREGRWPQNPQAPSTVPGLGTRSEEVCFGGKPCAWWVLSDQEERNCGEGLVALTPWAVLKLGQPPAHRRDGVGKGLALPSLGGESECRFTVQDTPPSHG